MKVKLIKPGLYGNRNYEAGAVIDVEDERLAHDIAFRGDGLVVKAKADQVIPAFGAVEVPSIALSEAEIAELDAPAEPAPAESPKPAEAPKPAPKPVPGK